MNYQALARQWRPRTFSQLLGQEHVIRPLIHSLNQNRLHHAYLFTGTRGVGKTSVARLLAKALNCEQAISANPCLECDTCKMIEEGRFIDLIEVDGASRTRVEDTRELLENVQYLPTQGRFKIYLIDEVHMLSQHSFNALLKTLEEPPSHVKFILATTEPQKLPVTVLSRCLQFNLRHLSTELISEQLEAILQQESLPFEKAGLDILAHAAKGSMRDALSLLEQAIANAKDELTSQSVKQVLGYTQKDYALQLLQALAESDAAKLIALSREVANEGGHFRYVLESLLSYLHEITINQHLSSDKNLLENTTPVQTLTQQFSLEDVQLFYQIGMKGSEEMHLAPSLSIGFEMVLLRMLTFRPALGVERPALAYQSQQNQQQNFEAIVQQEKRGVFKKTSKPIDTPSETLDELISAPISETKSSHQRIEAKAVTLSEPGLNCFAINEESSLKKAQKEDWNSIVSQLDLSGFALSAIQHTILLNRLDQELTLGISQGHEPLFTSAIVSQIEKALSAYYNEKLKIKISNSSGATESSPAKGKEIEHRKKQQEASLSLDEDPFFQHVKKEFSAEVVKNSILYVKDKL